MARKNLIIWLAAVMVLAGGCGKAPVPTLVAPAPTANWATYTLVPTAVQASLTPFSPTSTAEITFTPLASTIPTPQSTSYPSPIFSNRLAIPEGQYLVYERSNGEENEFWVITLDGIYQERLTSALPTDGYVTLYSNASMLAFITSVYKNDEVIYKLYTYDLMGNTLKEVITGSNCTSPSWAPDGTRLAVECNYSIVVVSLLDGSRTVLALASEENTVFLHTPVWSPDGEKIAYIRGPRHWIQSSDDGIYITDASCLTDPSTCPDLTRGPLVAADEAYIAPMAWSSDGRYLVVGDGDSYTQLTLQVVDTWADTRRTLVENITEGGVAWSPDGNWIAYDDMNSLYLVPAVGGEPVLLMEDAGMVVSWVTIWNFYVGETLLISPSGGNLTLRDTPTLNGVVLQQLQPGDTVTILSGPVEADGYTWWQMQTGDGTVGWAVNIPEWYAPVTAAPTATP